MPNLAAFEFERLEATKQPQGFSPKIIGNAESVFITLEEGSIRYRYDGGAPGRFFGHLLEDRGNLTLKGIQQITAFRFVASSDEPILQISYERT